MSDTVHALFTATAARTPAADFLCTEAMTAQAYGIPTGTIAWGAAAEQVERLRAWASGRCLSASTPGLFHRDSTETLRPGRRVRRDPSNN